MALTVEICSTKRLRLARNNRHKRLEECLHRNAMNIHRSFVPPFILAVDAPNMELQPDWHEASAGEPIWIDLRLGDKPASGSLESARSGVLKTSLKDASDQHLDASIARKSKLSAVLSASWR